MALLLHPVAWLFAGIGMSLGLLGGGGAVFAIPVLVYGLGMEPAMAVGTSLAIVGATSLAAAVLHFRRGQVLLSVALPFGATGIAGAYLGSQATPLVPGTVLLLSVAVLMVLIGAWMLWGRGRTSHADLSGVRKDTPTSPRLWLSLSIGFGVGLLTGFLGVGGGFLIVPALVYLMGVSIRQAVGTSLAIIVMNSASGFVGHMGQGGVDLAAAAIFTAFALLGITAGLRLGSSISGRGLEKVFAGFVIAAGGIIATHTLVFG